jgi:hypothetical protein
MIDPSGSRFIKATVVLPGITRAEQGAAGLQGNAKHLAHEQGQAKSIPRIRARTLQARRSSDPSAMPAATVPLKSLSSTMVLRVHAVVSAMGSSAPKAVIELHADSRSAASCRDPCSTTPL